MEHTPQKDYVCVCIHINKSSLQNHVYERTQCSRSLCIDWWTYKVYKASAKRFLAAK
jgi:hypothetical protein